MRTCAVCCVRRLVELGAISAKRPSGTGHDNDPSHESYQFAGHKNLVVDVIESVRFTLLTLPPFVSLFCFPDSASALRFIVSLVTSLTKLTNKTEQNVKQNRENGEETA
eukprot:scaffold26645_cov150-Skeletonema_menzelii.AAC.20